MDYSLDISPEYQRKNTVSAAFLRPKRSMNTVDFFVTLNLPVATVGKTGGADVVLAGTFYGINKISAGIKNVLDLPEESVQPDIQNEIQSNEVKLQNNGLDGNIMGGSVPRGKLIGKLDGLMAGKLD